MQTKGTWRREGQNKNTALNDEAGDAVVYLCDAENLVTRWRLLDSEQVLVARRCPPADSPTTFLSLIAKLLIRHVTPQYRRPGPAARACARSIFLSAATALSLLQPPEREVLANITPLLCWVARRKPGVYDCTAVKLPKFRLEFMIAL